MANYIPSAWRWSKPSERLGAFFPVTFENEVNRLMKDFFGNGGAVANSSAVGAYVPAVNVHETKEQYLVTAEVPGVTEKEIEISITDGVLTISGEKKEEIDRTEGKTHYTGRRYGAFSQQVCLESPVDEDKIDASVRNGVLTVKLPKSTTIPEKVKKVSVRAER